MKASKLCHTISNYEICLAGFLPRSRRKVVAPGLPTLACRRQQDLKLWIGPMMSTHSLCRLEDIDDKNLFLFSHTNFFSYQKWLDFRQKCVGLVLVGSIIIIRVLWTEARPETGQSLWRCSASPFSLSSLLLDRPPWTFSVLILRSFETGEGQKGCHWHFEYPFQGPELEVLETIPWAKVKCFFFRCSLVTSVS